MPVDSTVLLTPAFADADAFTDLVEDFLSQVPSFRPRHWGWVEPTNLVLSLPEIRALLNENGSPDITWKRKSPPKGWGMLSKRCDLLIGPQFASHALQVSADKAAQVDELINYLRHLVVQYGVEYAFCDSNTNDYRRIGFANGFAPTADNFMVFTHMLVKRLPDILWGQVFGPAYVRLFGLEKLLSAPAYKVEQLGPETVYIQLSESLFDMHDRYAEVDAVRQQVKQHLDDNIFFDARNPEGHVYRTPVFEFPG
jgi:hypothetical protein